MSGAVSPLPYLPSWHGQKKITFLCKCDIKRIYVGCRLTDIYRWEMYD